MDGDQVLAAADSVAGGQPFPTPQGPGLTTADVTQTNVPGLLGQLFGTVGLPDLKVQVQVRWIVRDQAGRELCASRRDAISSRRGAGMAMEGPSPLALFTTIALSYPAPMHATSASGEEPRQPRQAEESALKELPFPRYQIALVQDESEMILQPAYDLFPFLSDEVDARWDVELYTERTFEALLSADEQFDCIVLGLNTAWKSKIVRDALSKRLPDTGLCVLHQRGQGSLPFLSGELGLDVREFEEPIDRVMVAEQVEAADEILLNYPYGIPVGQTESRTRTSVSTAQLTGFEAYCGLTPSAESEWRTVLEVVDHGRRVPMLVRTRTGRDPPVAVCFVLLQPRRPEHLDLLGNILTWCVSGSPEALVVGDPTTVEEARLVHRKLRMQGTKAVRESVKSKSHLDFRCWPFHGIGDIVIPAVLDPTAAEDWPNADPAHLREWLRGGGRIFRLGPGEQVTITHGESDAHWVTRRWALWFLSEPSALWHGGAVQGHRYRGSVIGTRAVLRFLAALHDTGFSNRTSQPGLAAARHVLQQLESEGSGIDPARFGLQPPVNFLQPVTQLLRSRHPRSKDSVQHVEYSVSTTCSFLDINSLVGGEALDSTTVKAFEAWLRAEFEVVALEERLDIARCLADAELLEKALEGVKRRLASKRPLSAAFETKLREAVVACKLSPADVPWPEGSHPTVVERGLRMSPLLSANYLVALGDLEVHWGSSQRREHGLVKPYPRMVDRAVIGIGRHGALLPEDTEDGRLPHEMLSTRALALIAYFGRDTVPTHVIRSESQGLPLQLVSSVLGEAERLREENAEVHHQVKTIERASTALGVIVLVAMVGLGWLEWWLVGILGAPFLARVPIMMATLPIPFLGAVWLLERANLSSPWLKRLARLVDQGLAGIRQRWRERRPGQGAPTDTP